MKIKLLKDKYRLNSIIEEDEYFIIFKGEVIERPEMDVEIHVLKNRWMKDSALVQKITSEYQGQEKLSHHGITRIHDIDFFKNIYFVVKEHFEGKTLDQYIRENYTFSLSQIINIITQLTRILGYSFKEGLKTRTLLPVDILITNDFKVKILRFRSPRGSIKEDDKPMGTATDLFFIGTLLFELLNGKSIFSMEGSMVRKLKTAADVPILRKDEELNQKSNVFLRTVIYRCLTGQSEERYEGFNDLLVDLQKYIQEQVDMQDVRSSMELAAPEREDVAPMVESRASRQVVEMTDVPEDYRMENEADLARDYLLVDESGQRVMSMPEETGFALKLWLLLGFLLICATVFAGYVFY